MHLDRFLATTANLSAQNNMDCGIDAQEDAWMEAEGEVTIGEAPSRGAALLNEVWDGVRLQTARNSVLAGKPDAPASSRRSKGSRHV